MTIKVAIADDHPLFLDGLRLLLETTPDLEVLVTASDGEELLAALQDREVDVVMVDLDMPNTNGEEVAKRLSSRPGAPPVLMLTMHDDGDAALRALRAGARGYILKGSRHGAIVRALHAVAEGDTVLGGSVAPAVVQAVGGGRTRDAFPQLSQREAEVLALVAQGRDNSAVAGALSLSVKTVQNHVSSLLTKVGATTRAELVARARDATSGG